MGRLVAIILSLALLALTTGATEYLHNLDHRHQDAAATAGTASTPTSPQHHPPLHDETNCRVHAQLHLPLLSAGWVPLLVFLGLFVAFLTMLAPPPVSRPAFAYIDTRGPPILR